MISLKALLTKILTELTSINTKVSPIGTYVSKSLGTSGTQSIAHATSTDLLYVTLDPGTWVLIGQVCYNGGGTAGTYRGATINIGSSTSGTATVQVPGVSNGNTNVHISTILVLGSRTDIHLWALQGSGSSLNIPKSLTNLRAVRIK